MEDLDLLILGAGWTSTFLIPILQQHKLSFAATTTDGRSVANSPTISWRFDPDASTSAQHRSFSQLPTARFILVTFPLVGTSQSKTLVDAYAATHPDADNEKKETATKGYRFIQLGSTGIWTKSTPPDVFPWMTRHSAYETGDKRAIAEDELLGLGGCVLNLAGLWGGVRDPRHWIDRIGASKEILRGKTSLHMIHGLDVARLITRIVESSSHVAGDEGGNLCSWTKSLRGQRWMVTDGFVYDWWTLLAGWADVKAPSSDDDEMDETPTKQAVWVRELLADSQTRALPRSMETLGRCYDSQELWNTFGLTPLKGGLGL